MYSSLSWEAWAEQPSLGLKEAFAQALPDQGVMGAAPGSYWVLEQRPSCWRGGAVQNHPANPPSNLEFWETLALKSEHIGVMLGCVEV